MNKQAWRKLKAGDILLFPSGAIRTVIEGCSDKIAKRGPISSPAITLAKMNRSQYHNPTTVKFWTDVSRAGKSAIKIIGHTRKLFLRAEGVRLQQIGFRDLRSAIHSYARNYANERFRMGTPVCKKVLRLAKISLDRSTTTR